MNKCLLCGGLTADYFNYGARLGMKQKLVRCRKCRLIQTEPMPEENELKKWYQNYDILGEREPYYQGLAAADPWKTSEGIDIARQFALVKREFSNLQIRKISNRPALLDLGSGQGLFLSLVKRAGWRGVGVELNSRAAELSRARFGIEVLAGTIEDAALATESFDAVTLWDIFEHVRDPAGLLGRVESLLRPEGLVFIETPNADSFLDFAVLAAARAGVRAPAQTFYGMHHLTLWNEQNIRTVLEKFGFRILKIKQDFTPAGRVFRGQGFRDRFMRFAVGAVQTVSRLTERQNKLIITAVKS